MTKNRSKASYAIKFGGTDPSRDEIKLRVRVIFMEHDYETKLQLKENLQEFLAPIAKHITDGYATREEFKMYFRHIVEEVRDEMIKEGYTPVDIFMPTKH